MRFGEATMLDHQFVPFKLAAVPDEALPKPSKSLELNDATAREIRLAQLATAPLAECLAAVASLREPLPLVLALPELQPSRPIDGKRFLSLLVLAGARFDVDRSVAVDAGRAGGLIAISRACEMIRTGQRPFVIAGGVDTYRDLFVLGTLDAERRVKSDVHMDGFVPGEGAAFLLLASATAARAHGAAPLASLTRVVDGVETGHLYATEAYRGDGLATALSVLVKAGAVATPFGEVWSSMNGENHWAKEWGVSYLRNRAAFAEDYDTQHPADCVGDTGAACGPLMVALAAMGMRDGYRRSPALVYCSSDRGPRAVLGVERA
jgi:3-oxoacyl-[acyl-carrier-protein] synthase-1